MAISTLVCICALSEQKNNMRQGVETMSTDIPLKINLYYKFRAIFLVEVRQYGFFLTLFTENVG